MWIETNYLSHQFINTDHVLKFEVKTNYSGSKYLVQAVYPILVEEDRNDYDVIDAHDTHAEAVAVITKIMRAMVDGETHIRFVKELDSENVTQ